MKILVLHQYFLGENDPGGSRYNQFVKYWEDAGCEITVVAGTVHYATGKKDSKYKCKLAGIPINFYSVFPVKREEDYP